MPEVRDRPLDGLRAIAVSCVLYAHFFAAETTYWGHVGVRLFFVLSGFLITRLLLEARSAAAFQPAAALRSFYIRRALRIFPAYFAMLGFVWFVDLEQSRGSLTWHALYVSNFWYALRGEWTPWVIGHTWSLSIEEQFYVVWPLVILLAPRRHLAKICVGMIAFSFAYRFYWPITGSGAIARDLLPPASMDALASGALLAVYRDSNGEAPRWARLAWLPVLAAFLTLLWFAPEAQTPFQDWARWLVREVLLLLPMAMIIDRCTSGSAGAAGRVLGTGPPVAVGRISYGIYLYHPIVLALAVKAQGWIPVNVSEQGLGRLVIATSGTLVVAALSFVLFESPINALKRHFPYVASRRNVAAARAAPVMGRLGPRDDSVPAAHFRTRAEGRGDLAAEMRAKERS
jgi:peptidoglycan/LPS O-acetylase OafA/YrhL